MKKKLRLWCDLSSISHLSFGAAFEMFRKQVSLDSFGSEKCSSKAQQLILIFSSFTPYFLWKVGLRNSLFCRWKRRETLQLGSSLLSSFTLQVLGTTDVAELIVEEGSNTPFLLQTTIQVAIQRMKNPLIIAKKMFKQNSQVFFRKNSASIMLLKVDSLHKKWEVAWVLKHHATSRKYHRDKSREVA